MVGDSIFIPKYDDENIKSEHIHKTRVSTPVPNNLVTTNFIYFMNIYFINTVYSIKLVVFLGSFSSNILRSFRNCCSHIPNSDVESNNPTISYTPKM